MKMRMKEDCFTTFTHVTLNGIAACWQRSLESSRILDGFNPKKPLRAHTTADVAIRWWKAFVANQSRRSLQRTIHAIQVSTFTVEGSAEQTSGPSLSGSRPSSAAGLLKSPNQIQFSALASHPTLPIVAGIIEQSTHQTMTSVRSLFPLITDYISSS